MNIKVVVIVNNPTCCRGIEKGRILSVHKTTETLGSGRPCYKIVKGSGYCLIEKRDVTFLANKIGGKLL